MVRLVHTYTTEILINWKADCVFPTRTARFGVALTHHGPLNLSKSFLVLLIDI